MLGCVISSLAAPVLICSIVNTSYVDPPKKHQRWSFNHEIHCGAVLLSVGRRASAASYADNRGIQSDIGGSAQTEVGIKYMQTLKPAHLRKSIK